MAIYMHDWAKAGEEQMLSDFGIDKSALDGVEIIVASYTYEDYTGDAYVLFRKAGQLYEVHAGHCSCYGLSESNYTGKSETQWQPEEADRTAILHRIIHGSWGFEEGVANAVRAALEQEGED